VITIFIYTITNKINNRVYVGQTNNFKRRMHEHKNILRSNAHSNPYLQEDYNLYGEENFVFEIVEECLNNENLFREDFWINYFGGIESNRTYNCQCSYKQNKFMIEKQNIKKLGRKRTNEFKLQQRERFLTNNPMKGKHHSLKTRERLSETHKGELNFMYGKRGKNSPNYGRKQPQYVKDKCREVNLGKRKYTTIFISQLREDYEILGTYTAVAKKYNMNVKSITNLIKYGTPAHPSCYK